MDATELKEILDKHQKWLKGEKDGLRADLSFTDLSFADLSSADLRFADLSFTDLSSADLSSADLSSANLSSADLSSADLRFADLRFADLRFANLSSANLSSAKNIKFGIDYISELETTKKGIICYKTFGSNYQPNPDWKIKKGSIIRENCCADKTFDCACGVNVSTIAWQISNHEKRHLPVWKCLIRWEWAIGVTIPYNTDGKFRCEQCELIAEGKIVNGKWEKL